MLLHQAVRGYAPRFGRAPAVTPELLALLEAGECRAAIARGTAIARSVVFAGDRRSS